MAALWASLPLPQSLSGGMHTQMHRLLPQTSAATNNCNRSSPFACPMPVQTYQMGQGSRQ